MLRRPTLEAIRLLLGETGLTGAGRQRWCCVLDADRTLAPMDTGRLIGDRLGVDAAIRAIFESGGYRESSFSRVAEVWGTKPAAEYLAALRDLEEEVVPYVQWLSVLNALTPLLPIIVVTAGIPHVWRATLDRAGFPSLTVIGGCHPALDTYVVCPDTKADLVRMLQAADWRVVAAGDSLIDLPMLTQADLGLFVPDSKGSPALRAELGGLQHVRHFSVDEQIIEELQPWTADDLVHHCLEQRHAD